MPLANPLPPRTIDVADLACQRGDRLLFANLNFSVAPGEALLLRGPNGVGKTSLIRILSGLLRPETGTVTIGGGGEEDRPAAAMHVLGHLSAVKARLTVEENLKFWSTLNGAERDLHDVLAVVGLAAIADLDAGHLSAGQTRRLALARLLASPRPIWLMDEPTSALDAQGDRLVARLIDEHLDQGGLVVAATHLDIGLNASARVKTLTLGATA
ncbi:MAG TPA: heme ABC exporter ATP-binding protein CcmA [Devosiaceae bacterium]|jgi:heme exporter protein A